MSDLKDLLNRDDIPIEVIHIIKEHIESCSREITQLREKERFLQAAFTSIQDGISVLNSDLTIRYTNDVMECWYSDSMPLVGRKCYECYHGTDKPCDPCPTIRCIKSGKTEHNVIPGYPDSPVKWVELFSYPITDPDNNEVTGVVEFVRDITELKRMQDKIIENQKMDSIGVLAGGIAHDFNNMLGVLGYTSMLLQREQDEKNREYLEKIAVSAMNASELTRKLLGFARKGKNIVRAVDLNETVCQVCGLLRSSIDQAQEIDIECIMCNDLHTIDGDPSQMMQMVMNLCVNAKEAMPDGGRIVIRTRNFYADAKLCVINPSVSIGDYIELTVSDTGFGICDLVRARMFEPFFTTKTGGEVTGTGLGLSTVYGIVGNHGGFIEVDTNEEKGAAFRVYLPAGKLSKQEPDHSEFCKKRGQGTILIVEDDDGMREMLADMTKELGYESILANSGIEGVDIYRKKYKEITWVILDMKMPRMGGREAFIEMKKINPDIRTLLATGYGLNEEVQGLLNLGIKDLLTKPFKMRELSEKLSVSHDNE